MRITVGMAYLVGAGLVVCALRVAVAQEGPGTPESSSAPSPLPARPFEFADFSWLNGNSRQVDSILRTKYFTGEVGST